MIAQTSLTLMLAGAAALVATGGAAAKSLPSERRADIHLGETTREQIQMMFGKPEGSQVRTTALADSTIDVWHYTGSVDDVGSGGTLFVECIHGVVNGYIFMTAIDSDRVDLNMDDYQNLRDHATRYEDVRRLAGPPDGEVHLPSNLLASAFGNLPEIWPPPDATQSSLYVQLGSRKKHHVRTMTMKLLVAFGSTDGNVVAVRRFDNTF